MIANATKYSARRRSKRGFTLTALAIVLAVAMTLLGFLSAQLWQAFVVHQQLTNACDAAGLAAAAALASSSYPSLLANTTKVGAPNIPTSAELQTARQNAAQIGYQVFRQCIVCGNPLANATLLPSGTQLDNNLNPLQNEVVINFMTQQPSGARQMDNTHGTHIVVSAATAVLSVFPISLFPNFTVQATGRSSSAKIDLAFCLDNSLSMTVDTLMYEVSRGWDQYPNQTKLVYLFGLGGNVNGSAGTPRSSLPQGWGLGATVRPQYIDSSNTSLNFNSSQRGAPGDLGQIPTNTGETPALSSQGVASATTWTDAVVLPSGNDGTNNNQVTVAPDAYGTFLYNGSPTSITWTYSVNNTQYTFSNVATMVEASRGNLETTTTFYNTYLKNFLPSIPAPQAGFQAAYEEYAMANTEPFHSECVQVSNFFQLLVSNTDAHVAFIPFGDGAGTAANQPPTYGQVAEWEVGQLWDPTFGLQQSNFPFLQVPLQQNDNPNMLSQVFGAIDALHNYSPTKTDLALQQAYNNLTNTGLTRLGAKRIVMLLSDGEPTDPEQNSYTLASDLGGQVIPIFPIAFLHGSQNQQQQASAFMQQLASSDNSGVTGGGGDGSTAYTISQANMATLQQVMRLIAHQYATLE
jgi:Tfp pilus assembly protein PilE